jgi:hypothetical protein
LKRFKKKGRASGTAQVLGGNAHEGRRDNVLSGEISVAALQKMMLHKRKVKHLKRLYIPYLTYCHINDN